MILVELCYWTQRKLLWLDYGKVGSSIIKIVYIIKYFYCVWSKSIYYNYSLSLAGYRDAECGWVMVGEEDHHHEEELPKSSLRTALFLVIYATKRGILEVCTCISSLHSHLFSSTHSVQNKHA